VAAVVAGRPKAESVNLLSPVGIWSDFRLLATPNLTHGIRVASVDAAISRSPTTLGVVVTGRDGNVYGAAWNSGDANFSELTRVAELNLI